MSEKTNQTDPASGSSTLTGDDHLAANPDVLTCRVGNDVVLFDAVKGHYYGLNEVGGAVYDLAADGRSLAEIHASLAAQFDVDPAVLWPDVRAFADQLVTMGFLRRPK